MNLAEKYLKEQNERYNWEFFLHKVFDKSYLEFISESKEGSGSDIPEITNEQIETTVNESMNILKNFNPTRGE